jgi:hypothetical protein
MGCEPHAAAAAAAATGQTPTMCTTVLHAHMHMQQKTNDVADSSGATTTLHAP